MTDPMDTISLPDIFWELLGEDEEDFLELEEISQGIWTMADETKILVKNMSDQHLVNTLAIIHTTHPWAKVFKEELKKRTNPKITFELFQTEGN